MTACVIASRRAPSRHLAPLRYVSAAATHAGCVRMINEDACLDLPDAGLWAVADGMGGHHAGAMASRCVVDRLSQVSNFESAFSFRRSVQNALHEANARLQEEAARTTFDAIGATVVAVLVHGEHYACVWAGDSRAYLWRDGHMQRITHDHTLAAELANAGRMSPPGDRSRKYAHVVTRAVGARPVLEMDCVYGSVQPGDRFLLCSDGLGIVDEETVEETIATSPVNQAAQSLIRLAVAGKAPDNVTAVVVEAMPLAAYA